MVLSVLLAWDVAPRSGHCVPSGQDKGVRAQEIPIAAERSRPFASSYVARASSLRVAPITELNTTDSDGLGDRCRLCLGETTHMPHGTRAHAK
eukprot:5013944-Prymnesium_polylepis.1